MRNTQLPGRSVVMSTEAMAATSQPMATETALQIMRDGGNALDAAIAASAVLSVVETYSTGIGGDCFILYHEAASGQLHALNGSGCAPAAASAETLRARGFETMPEKGILTVTVPGAIDAWHEANQKFGNLDFSTLLQPAIHYAEKGYAVTPIIAANWKGSEALLAQTAEANVAYLVDGKAPPAGTIHRQPDLAHSLRSIAKQGRDGFYQGAIAEEMVCFSDTHDGLLTLDDLANHKSEWVQPITSNYRGFDVFEIPPNGQGITTLMALNILAQTDVAGLAHLGADHIHLLSEAFTLAMAERDRFVADPNFNQLPVEHLLSNDFARSQYARIDMNQALSQPVESALPNHRDTVYLSVVDKDRNVCSFINSVFHSWGSGLVAGSTGINLNNRGAGFSLEPDHFNQLAGGKRPMNTIIPAMVYRQGKPVLSFGVMGGQYQAMGQSYVLSNWIDYGMDIQEALDAARFFLYAGVLEVETGVPAAARTELSARGHTLVGAETSWGGGQAIVIDWENGVLQGGSDPRKDGHAAGF
ncbi:MAG: gamma-glutamyltransferase [Gammaproteobacteria bacterium]|nr:gamma-glutamyltransferase [Gammaproteobacteria bacterium]MCP4984011.1 gamma-glutamyltransferase [Gammaproteobacteria bacterium]